MVVVAVLASLAGSVPVTAQDPLEWLAGNWIESTKPRSKGKAAAEPAATLQVEVAGGTLRIIENGADGEDLRCRLDGTESQYRQTKRQATVDYLLECAIGPQSVEMNGSLTAGGVQGFPPREFELTKKYELAKDGSLRKRDQLWGIIPGLGRVPISDTASTFARQR
jgi:hypothetical protein